MMGLVSKEIHIGDVVVIVSGAHMPPFSIQPEEEKLHGIMHCGTDESIC
jgi:hypothetical protein